MENPALNLTKYVLIAALICRENGNSVRIQGVLGCLFVQYRLFLLPFVDE